RGPAHRDPDRGARRLPPPRRAHRPRRGRHPARLHRTEGTPVHMTITRESVARLVDHTLLKPEATAADVAALVAEANELGTYSICISPSRLPVAAGNVLVATVCGFPSGAHHSDVKAAEAARAVAHGAHE